MAFFLCHRKAVKIIEIFKLFGSILIDNDKANEAIDETDDKAKKTSGTFGEMLVSAVKMGAGIALAVGAAVVAVGGLAVSFTDDLQKSLNGVQASTGATDEAMVGMKDAMLAIYNNNFGESFEDIGTAMKTISQQTGLTGDALQKATESGLALRDTFGLEVNESIRTVDMMMKQFGISSDEAFNLIAQGAQKGLDKNGNLLDSINEYSVHFKQLGFSSEEMFNMMANGAKSGVFDIDKLGDAMKEFGIRSKDGSKTSSEGFAALGLDAGKMTKAFAKGGDESKEAFGKVAKALFEIKDPVAQNAAGVALFGTQWEDIGVKGVQALVSTKGEIDKNKDALNQINDVKYDTFGEAMKGIGRNLQTGILLPLGDSVLPMLQSFQTWIIEKMPTIKNEIVFAFNAAGNEINFMGAKLQEAKDFFTEHWNVVAPILAGIAAGAITFGTIKLAIEAWSAVTKIATAVQWALNIALDANPIGLVVAAIGLLVAAGVALYMNFDYVKAKAMELWVSVENSFKSGINKAIDLINDLIEIMNKIPGVNVPLIARVRLDTSQNSTADGMQVGRNAAGTNNWRGGLTWVGEEGPELVNLPRGSQVFTNDESLAMAQNSGGTTNNTVHVAQLVVREEADIDKISRRLFQLQQSKTRGLGVVPR